jgi:hypothetical protein
MSSEVAFDREQYGAGATWAVFRWTLIPDRAKMIPAWRGA